MLAYRLALMGRKVVGVGIPVGEHLETLITLRGGLHLGIPTIACEREDRIKMEENDLKLGIDRLLDHLLSTSKAHIQDLVHSYHCGAFLCAC